MLKCLVITCYEDVNAIRTCPCFSSIRNYALFMVLLNTGLRVSKLLALNMKQYNGKHFTNVKRKGKAVSRKVFIAKHAREVLDQYIEEERGKKPGPVFCSNSGKALPRQTVDLILKAIAAQANSTLPEEEHIQISAHILRHTFLRKVTRKYGIEYAKEVSGQVSDKYIWRYIQPSDDEKEQAIDELF